MSVQLLDLNPVDEDFRSAVLLGLRQRPRRLSSKFLYDANGSELFEEICRQPEYYPTRTEEAILREHAREIAHELGSRALLIEFGSGASRKTRILLDQLDSPVAYVPIDISKSALLEAARELVRDYPALDVVALCADFTLPLDVPAGLLPVGGTRAAFFPGSTIGNLTPDEAVAFLARIGKFLGRGKLLIGVDLVKPVEILEPAYNDAAGVTAWFNLNLLTRLRRELGGTLDPAAFAHRAFFNREQSRIEMHLLSLRDQQFTVAGERFEIAAGESIHTENSYKYTLEGFEKLAAAAGYQISRIFADSNRWFAVYCLEIA